MHGTDGIGKEYVNVIRLFLHLLDQSLNFRDFGNVCWHRECLALDWKLVQGIDGLLAGLCFATRDEDFLQ